MQGGFFVIRFSFSREGLITEIKVTQKSFYFFKKVLTLFSQYDILNLTGKEKPSVRYLPLLEVTKTRVMVI